MGELELIAAIETALADRSGRLVRWTGDDAAVTRARPFAVTSIDTLVDGVHFRRATHGLRDIGWKALATALSDLAAMGAEAGEAYVSVVLPADVDEPLELIHGMEELASETGVTIAGGDVVSGPVLVLTAAVTGRAPSRSRASWAAPRPAGARWRMERPARHRPSGTAVLCHGWRRAARSRRPAPRR